MPPASGPGQTSSRPGHFSLWSLVPQEEVGSEDSLASGLGSFQGKPPGPLWCLGWLGRREKGQEEVLPAAPPTAHRNATPPSTPTWLTMVSFSPLQLDAQDSLSVAGDIMGASTPLFPSHSPGNMACPP